MWIDILDIVNILTQELTRLASIVIIVTKIQSKIGSSWIKLFQYTRSGPNNTNIGYGLLQFTEQ